MKLVGNHTALFGKKKEGKSNLVQHIASTVPNTLVYDTCREHDPDVIGKRYVPEHRKGDKARAEAGEFVSRVVTDQDREKRPDLIIFEEASRYMPNSGGTSDAIIDLIDLARHYDVGILAVARRPAKVDTDVVELADAILSFYLSGPNDRKKLDAIEDGAGDVVNDLDRYHFAAIEGREIRVHEPVPEMDTTGEL